MHSEKRTKLRKPSNLLLQIPFDSSRVDRVAEKGGYILTLNKEMFVWLTASDKSIAQWLYRCGVPWVLGRLDFPGFELRHYFSAEPL